VDLSKALKGLTKKKAKKGYEQPPMVI